MILPTKHLSQDRAILKLGGDILAQLTSGRTVSELWEAIKRHRTAQALPPVPFDWFVLALSFLFAVNAIELQHGVLEKVSQS